jgi:hypothetical protein
MTDHLARLAAAAGIAAICLVGLTACGGGGSDSAGDGLTQQQREDATASTWPGMLVFAQGQIAGATADTNDPREISGISPPQADTAEPALL